MLVETIDRLIEIMAADPEFKHFTFDGQSVWIEDYLEVKPQMRERLRALIEAGRIQVGPWYSLPDHFASHPEALVRNLLIGHRLSESMGGVTKFGYSIFSFSQIAQLPQIYSGFGIDSLIFYKLYPVETLKKSEFWWESPDGTQALCSRLGPLARANFYFSFTIPVILGGDALSTEEGAWQVRFTDGAKICRLRRSPRRLRRRLSLPPANPSTRTSCSGSTATISPCRYPSCRRHCARPTTFVMT
jgi:hypothetical protein